MAKNIVCDALLLFLRKKTKKPHSQLLKTFFCFFLLRRCFLMLSERAQQWALLICSKRPSTKAEYSGLDISGSFDIKTRVQVFCIALSQWPYLYPSEQLNYSIYFTIQSDIWTHEIVPRLSKLSKSVGSFCIRCGLGRVYAAKRVPLVHGRFLRKPQKRPKMWFLGIKTSVGPVTSILSVHGRCWKFLWYILKNLN